MTVTLDQPRSIEANFAENLAPGGTPEWWLVSHGLTNQTFAQEELRDTDGDGMFAWQEYGADTVPTNAESVLRVLNISAEAGGFKIEWKGGIKAWQYLECRQNLLSTSEQWIAIFTNYPPTPVATNIVDSTATNQVRFYRLNTHR